MGIKPRKKDGGIDMNDYPIIEQHEGGGIILAKLDELINFV